jgi:hypothetical protein
MLHKILLQALHCFFFSVTEKLFRSFKKSVLAHTLNERSQMEPGTNEPEMKSGNQRKPAILEGSAYQKQSVFSLRLLLLALLTSSALLLLQVL